MDSDFKKYLAIGGGIAVGGISSSTQYWLSYSLRIKSNKSTSNLLIATQWLPSSKKPKKRISIFLSKLQPWPPTLPCKCKPGLLTLIWSKHISSLPNLLSILLRAFKTILKRSAKNSKSNVSIILSIDSDFSNSVEHYAKNEDAEIKYLIEEQERDYLSSLAGKMPQPKVTVP